MIQILILAAKATKHSRNWQVFFSSVAFAFLLAWILLNSSEADTKLLMVLLSNILLVSSIISAILITFLVSKVFQERQRRQDIFDKYIIQLSNKITDFRRIAHKLLSCYDGFWDSEMRKKLDNDYRTLKQWDIDIYASTSEKDQSFSKDEKKIMDNYINEKILGKELFLDLRTLVGVGNNYEVVFLDLRNYDFTYSQELLQQWHEANIGNGLWYYLVNKWFDYKEVFSLDKISSSIKEEILIVTQKIDSAKYMSRKFDNKLLGDISDDFVNYYIPRLLQFTNQINYKPSIIVFLNWILAFLLSSGVLLPIILLSISINPHLLFFFSFISMVTICTTYFWLIVKLKSVLMKEIQIV